MPSWEQFLNQHDLDPTQYPDWSTWNKLNWNVWLQGRLGGNYASKSINSVIVATPEQILATFPSHGLTGYSREGFFWSQDQFPIFVFQLDRYATNPDLRHTVRRLPPMFFLALIVPDPNRPVHFHAQSPEKMTSGNNFIRFNDYPLVE